MSTSTQQLEATVRENTDSEHAGTMQLVSFHLADETYGVEIKKVREIILMCEITRIPQAPHYVQGLINLRSAVIPVIDLRARFGLPESAITPDSRILVVNIRSKTVGIVVDAVDEVLRVSKEQIAPAPNTVAGYGNQYVSGLVRLDSRLLILLEVDQLLAEGDAEAIQSLTAGIR